VVSGARKNGGGASAPVGSSRRGGASAPVDSKRRGGASAPLRVASWNVNGIRACAKKGFFTWLEAAGADVVGVQEVRATAEQAAELATPAGFHTCYSSAERLGYSGVGLFGRLCPDDVDTRLGDAAMDAEGRLQIARFGALTVANVYFPNGSGKDRDNGRVPFKLAFYRALFERLLPDFRAGRPILVMGDFNTAHREIDLARPKSNEGTSGFLPEEREELDRWIRAGFVDTFRSFEPGPGHYTWWSQRQGVREKNIGWRIDLVLASPGAAPFVRDARIHPDVMGSDHCPISVELDRAVLTAR
jgi:exodeoxyribonuclease-3